MDPAPPPAPGWPGDGDRGAATAQDGSARPRGGDRRRLAWLSTLVGVLVGGLAGAFVVRELTAEWGEVRDALADASRPWIGGGLVLALLAMTAMGWVWPDVMALLGVRVGRARALCWYYVGELGKYLPGGVWPVLGRGEMARRGGVPGSRAYASVGLSLVTLYLAAMLVAVGLLPFALGDDGPGGAVAVLLLLPLGLAALHPRVIEPLLGAARRLTGRPLPLTVPAWRDTVVVVARYGPSWLLVGGATAAVAHAVDPDASPARIAFAAVLSWIAGFLAVPVPAGAGVREAVFLAACGLSPELGATVAVASRVLFIVVDGGGAAVSAALLRRTGRTATVVPVGPSVPPVEADRPS